MTIATRSAPRQQAIARKLARALERAQRESAPRELRLDRSALRALSHALLDFTEDLGDEGGLWAAYERHNLAVFGSRLPLEPGADQAARVRHLLWILYPVLVEDVQLSPTHVLLQRMAHGAAELLRREGWPAPGGETQTRRMLAGPNVRAEEVKRKLVWLGTHSYMFAAMHGRYMAEHARPGHRLDAWDDFLCQECTPWSGLGAIDVLAAVLDLPGEDRETLKTWHLRHASAYRVLAIGSASLRLQNVVNEREYGVRLETDFPVKVGQLIHGSLVPWRGDWHWSGAQRVFDEVSDDVVASIRQAMLLGQSHVVCRFWPEQERRVRQQAAQLHASALAYHGDDLISYPNGLSMAADLERELRLLYESRPAAARERARRRHGLGKDRPELSLPDEVVQHGDGLGVFLNPEEGKEIMLHFTTLVSGLRRAGGALTPDEAATIRGFVLSDTISPQFVRRVVRDHGAESLKAAFHLDGGCPPYWLEYLLRKHKGQFHRRRFPTLAVVD